MFNCTNHPPDHPPRVPACLEEASEGFYPELDDTAPLMVPIPKRSLSPFSLLLERSIHNQIEETFCCENVERSTSSSSDISEPESVSSESDDERSAATRGHPDQSCLPEERRTLVLDLDETLVRCTTRKTSCTEPVPPHDAKTTIQIHGVSHDVFVSFRPHLHNFLEQASAAFTLAVFTAATQQYADALISLIDPENKYFHGARFYRNSCRRNGAKDLRLITNDMSSVLLLDNTPNAFQKQKRNGVLISSYLGPSNDRPDNALLAILPFLSVLSRAADVRKTISRFGNGTQQFGSV